MDDTKNTPSGGDDTGKKVIVYSTPTCHFCHMAKDFFKEKGIEYTDYDVSVDAAKRQEMVEKTGQMGVPVILIGDEVVIGFDQARISTLLGV
jgi:glutaredoxin 3